MRAALAALAPSALGLSTGAGAREPGGWRARARRALAVAGDALELAGIGDRAELAALVRDLVGAGLPAGVALSVHAPAGLAAEEVADLLAALPPGVERIVVHPDRIGDPAAVAPLGARLVLENMNARKRDGRTPEELEVHFRGLPRAGLCLDLAHVATHDPTLALADRLLEAHGARLRQLHLSGADPAGGHRPLALSDVRRYEPVLRRCRAVPWILEREVPPGAG